MAPALVTTVSISAPPYTTTNAVVTGGRPSVESMVEAPVQLWLTLQVALAGVWVKISNDLAVNRYRINLAEIALAIEFGDSHAYLLTGEPSTTLFCALYCETVGSSDQFVVNG